MAEDFKTKYRDAARVDGYGRVFFIGPFGRRVSFASQQRRAFNTVWALQQEGLVGNGKEVAVIGGGLAGLAVASALLAYRSLVWLYEERGDVLKLQDRTLHRYIHPSVNFWPDEDLQPTTVLPFMDWYADKCSSIIDNVRIEWQSSFRKHLSRFYNNSKVTAVKEVGKRVTIHASGTAPASREYDLAVFATGFGAETVVDGTNTQSYWVDDELWERSERGEDILISGTGDGGLIDVLRAVHRDFAGGELTLTLAKMLDNSGLRENIRIAEKDVFEQASSDKKKASELLSAEYHRLFESAPEISRSLLDASLLRRDKPVRLVGREPQPYSITAAPIHKFMLTHALAEGQIKYEMAELEPGRILSKAGVNETLDTSVYCVARHGPSFEMSGLLTDSQKTTLRERQQHLLDYPKDQPYEHSFWARRADLPTPDRNNVKFLIHRRKLVQNFLLDEFGANLAIGRDSADKPQFVIQVDPGKSDDESLPTSLFGVAAVPGEKVVVDAY